MERKQKVVMAAEFKTGPYDLTVLLPVWVTEFYPAEISNTGNQME